jgi:signal transduction histidine kinase
MPPAATSTFLQPLIHGLDLALAKLGTVIARERARLEGGAYPGSHHRDLVNLPSVAEHVAREHRNDAGARFVRFLIDVAPDALVIGDSNELHRFIERLVLDALDRTPVGGSVVISGTITHGIVTLVFASHGPWRSSESACGGPTEASLARRSSRLPPRDFCPTELETILRAHHGEMDVSVNPGERAHFVVRLPVS